MQVHLNAPRTVAPIPPENVHPADTRTYYVHLDSARIETVHGVTALDMTEDEVILRRNSEPPVVYQRNDVYFATCDDDVPPPGL